MGDKVRIGVITETSTGSFFLGRLNLFECGTLKWAGHQDFNVRPRSFFFFLCQNSLNLMLSEVIVSI